TNALATRGVALVRRIAGGGVGLRLRRFRVAGSLGLGLALAAHVAPGIVGDRGVRNLAQRILVGLLDLLGLLDLVQRLARPVGKQIDMRRAVLGDGRPRQQD